MDGSDPQNRDSSVSDNLELSHFPPFKTINLAGGTAWLYLFRLDSFLPRLSHLINLLTPEEQQQSERFHFERDKHRFIISRGLLRLVISGYEGVPPEKIVFRYGKNGKPSLPERQNPVPIKFNLSHAGELVLIGISRGSEIGVDIEEIKEISGMDDIIERFASEKEKKELRSCPEEEKETAFFKWWTAQESLLKCIGIGLSGLSQDYSDKAQIFKDHIYIDNQAYLYSVCWFPL